MTGTQTLCQSASLGTAPETGNGSKAKFRRMIHFGKRIEVCPLQSGSFRSFRPPAHSRGGFVFCVVCFCLLLIEVSAWDGCSFGSEQSDCPAAALQRCCIRGLITCLLTEYAMLMRNVRLTQEEELADVEQFEAAFRQRVELQQADQRGDIALLAVESHEQIQRYVDAKCDAMPLPHQLYPVPLRCNCYFACSLTVPRGRGWVKVAVGCSGKWRAVGNGGGSLILVEHG